MGSGFSCKCVKDTEAEQCFYNNTIQNNQADDGKILPGNVKAFFTPINLTAKEKAYMMQISSEDTFSIINDNLTSGRSKSKNTKQDQSLYKRKDSNNNTHRLNEESEFDQDDQINAKAKSHSSRNKVSPYHIPVVTSFPLEIINEQNGESTTVNNVTTQIFDRPVFVPTLVEKIIPENIIKVAKINKQDVEIIYDEIITERKKTIEIVDNKNIKKNTRTKSWNKKTNSDTKKPIIMIGSIDYESEQKWRDHEKVSKIITMNKLTSLIDDDIIYHGELFKLSMELQANKNYDVQSYAYSTKFCIVTKTEFKYYTSKEAFLRLMKPLLVFPLNYILEHNALKDDFLKDIHIKKLNIREKENGQLHHFSLKIINLQNSLLMTTPDHKKMVSELSINGKNDMSKNNLQGSNSFLKSFVIPGSPIYDDEDVFKDIRKISHFDIGDESKNSSNYNVLQNSHRQISKKRNENSTKFNNLLIFASNNHNSVITWLNIIDLLITK